MVFAHYPRGLEDAARALDADNAVLCATCGALYSAGHTTCTGQACGATVLWPVRRLSTTQDTVSGCLACGARGAAMVRQFETGGDAAASVAGSGPRRQTYIRLSELRDNTSPSLEQ